MASGKSRPASAAALRAAASVTPASTDHHVAVGIDSAYLVEAIHGDDDLVPSRVRDLPADEPVLPPCGTIAVPRLIGEPEDGGNLLDRARPQQRRGVAVKDPSAFVEERRGRLRIDDGIGRADDRHELGDEFGIGRSCSGEDGICGRP